MITEIGVIGGDRSFVVVYRKHAFITTAEVVFDETGGQSSSTTEKVDQFVFLHFWSPWKSKCTWGTMRQSRPIVLFACTVNNGVADRCNTAVPRMRSPQILPNVHVRPFRAVAP